MGLFESARRPAKMTQQYLPWRFLFPSPAPPRKETMTPPRIRHCRPTRPQSTPEQMQEKTPIIRAARMYG